MSFTVESRDLARLVERMKPVQSTRLPWAAWFTWADDELTLSAAGFNVSAEATCSANAREVGDACLPLAKLAAWLPHVSGAIEVTVEPDAGATFASSDASLPVPIYAEQVGRCDPEDPDEDAELPSAVWPAIGRVAWAATRLDPDKTPSWREMIHVAPGLVWAGSDLTGVVSVTVETNRQTVSLYPEVTSLLRQLSAETTAKVDGRGRLHLRDSAGKYILSTFVGEVPDVPSMLIARYATGDKKPEERVIFDRKELIDALDTLKAVCAADSFRVVLRLREPLLEVETGMGPSTMALSCEPVEADTAVHLSALRSMLGVAVGEQVTILTGEDRPIVLIEDDLTAVLAPIRLSGQARPTPRRAKKAS